MIKIITDSAADIPKSEAEPLGIQMLPIPITVDGKTYLEGIDFTSEEYYKILAASKAIPTTAQITVIQFAEAFAKALEEGYDHIICVTITATASAAYIYLFPNEKLSCWLHLTYIQVLLALNLVLFS